MSAFLRRALAIARKEVRYLLREPRILLVCLGEPIFTLLIYGYCLNFDLRNLPFAVWDQDRGQYARQLVRQLEETGGQDPAFFHLERDDITDPEQIAPLLSSGKARFVLVIPRGFGRDMAAGRMGEVQALFDAADSNTAGVAAGYLGSVIAAYNVNLTTDEVARKHGAHRTARAGAPAMAGGQSVAEPIDLRWRVLYNPNLSSRWFIVPGLLAVILSILAATLTSTAITRERELGSMESLLTSPVSAPELVLGKMVPYLAVSVLNVVLILVVSLALFRLSPRGSVLTLTVFTLLFLPGMLSLGMIISGLVRTQQVALVVATLTGFLPTLFLTGFAFPRNNMWTFLQYISEVLPATHYIIAMRAIYLKGTGWSVLWPQAVVLLALGTALFGLAVLTARKNLARGLG